MQSQYTHNSRQASSDSQARQPAQHSSPTNARKRSQHSTKAKNLAIYLFVTIVAMISLKRS